MKEPIWVSKDAALAMHDRQLAEHGGITGVRDLSLLEYALMKPQNIFLYSENQVNYARLAAS
jgi:death-on-curing protein